MLGSPRAGWQSCSGRSGPAEVCWLRPLASAPQSLALPGGLWCPGGPGGALAVGPPGPGEAPVVVVGTSGWASPRAEAREETSDSRAVATAGSSVPDCTACAREESSDWRSFFAPLGSEDAARSSAEATSEISVLSRLGCSEPSAVAASTAPTSAAAALAGLGAGRVVDVDVGHSPLAYEVDQVIGAAVLRRLGVHFPGQFLSLFALSASQAGPPVPSWRAVVMKPRADAGRM